MQNRSIHSILHLSSCSFPLDKWQILTVAPMNHSLNILKGVILGIILGTATGVINLRGIPGV